MCHPFGQRAEVVRQGGDRLGGETVAAVVEVERRLLRPGMDHQRQLVGEVVDLVLPYRRRQSRPPSALVPEGAHREAHASQREVLGVLVAQRALHQLRERQVVGDALAQRPAHPGGDLGEGRLARQVHAQRKGVMK